MKIDRITAAVTLALSAFSVSAVEIVEAGEGSASGIERVSIVGNKTDSLEILGSTSIIGPEELETFEFDDVAQILSRVPGVNIRQEDGYGLRPNIGFRGVTPNRSKKINILEDGVLIGPAPYSAPAAYYVPMMAKMSAVEVTKGAEMIKYGPNTVAGVLNLVTRQIPTAYETEVEVSAGSGGYQKLGAYHGGRVGDFGYLVEAISLSADGFKTLDNGGDTGFEKTDFLAKFNYRFNAFDFDHIVELKTSYADELSNETYLGLSDDDFADTPYRRYAATQLDLMDWEHEQVQLSHEMIASNWDMTTRLYRNDFERSWSKINGMRANQGGTPPSLQTILSDPLSYQNYYDVLTGNEDSSILELIVIGDNAREYYSQGIQSDISIDLPLLGKEHFINAGIRFHEDEIQRNHVEDDFLMRSGVMESAGVAQRVGTTNLENSEAFSAYIQSQWRFDALTLAVAGRYESIDGYALNRLSGEWQSKSDSVFLPALSALYRYSEKHAFLFGVHKGFVPTSPQQSPDKEPEDSTNVELGWRYQDTDMGAEVIAFYNMYDNLAETCSLSAGENCTTNIDVQYDAGAVDVYGLENSVNGIIRVSQGDLVLPWFVSYTYTQSEFKNSFKSAFKQWGDVTAGESLPYLADHMISAGISLEIDRWDVSLRISHQSEMKEAAGEGVNLSGVSTEPLTMMDISAGYSVSDKGRVYMKVDNVFDTIEVVSRRPYGARPNRPNQVFVGYKHQF